MLIAWLCPWPQPLLLFWLLSQTLLVCILILPDCFFRYFSFFFFISFSYLPFFFFIFFSYLFGSYSGLCSFFSFFFFIFFSYLPFFFHLSHHQCHHFFHLCLC